MNKTLRISFALRNAYKVNSVLYSLKQIPGIKEMLPSSLYGAKGLKAFVNVLAVVWELISAFLGKLLYFWIMIYLVLGLYDGAEKSSLFLHVFLCLSIVGASLNTYLFNPTKDKYYGMILLRMNAKEYTLISYSYALLKIIIGFAIFGLMFGLRAGVPAWVCLMMPFFVAGLKLTVAAQSLRKYEKNGNPVNENALGKLGWFLAVVLLAAAYGLPILKVVVPQWITVSFMTCSIVAGALSIPRVWNFRFYKECYRELLQPTLFQKDTVAEAVREQNKKYISTDTTITSELKGFEYLNELFIKRHHKLLWKASRIISVAALCIISGMLLAFYFLPEFRQGTNQFIMTGLPLFVFIMYTINRGTNFTQALFMNCDHSLLTYSFYKKPDFVLRLFRIRLREIIKVNLLPAAVIGVGLALLLYASGGTDNVLNYAILVVSILALSAFFSVHYLTIYYLLQPYNAGTEAKSATYQVALTGTYLVCFFIMKLEIPTLLFGIMSLLFCALYCVGACILVYKIAPTTFRLRV